MSRRTPDAVICLMPTPLTTDVPAFRGPWGFLSNMYPSVVGFEGALYPSAEHAFQAAKTLDEEERYIRVTVLFHLLFIYHVQYLI